MATKCIDNKRDFELVNINTSDPEINKVANKYIQDRRINVMQSVGFSCLLNHIASTLNINTEDTDSLIYYFNIYIELCTICNILPDMTGYSFFINVPYDTMRDWLDGTMRSTTHTQIVKKMREICKMTCVSEAGRGNIGAIYVSKAIHGLSDSAPAAQYTQNNLYINAPVSREAIAAEFGAVIEGKAPLELPGS